MQRGKQKTMGASGRKADLGWLENPEIFAVNRMPAHSDHVYASYLAGRDTGVKAVSYTHLG